MEEAPTIVFSCPSCQTELEVPQSQAGVEGPCPVCDAQIRAPGDVDSDKLGSSKGGADTGTVKEQELISHVKPESPISAQTGSGVPTQQNPSWFVAPHQSTWQPPSQFVFAEALQGQQDIVPHVRNTGIPPVSKDTIQTAFQTAYDNATRQNAYSPQGYVQVPSSYVTPYGQGKQGTASTSSPIPYTPHQAGNKVEPVQEHPIQAPVAPAQGQQDVAQFVPDQGQIIFSQGAPSPAERKVFEPRHPDSARRTFPVESPDSFSEEEVRSAYKLTPVRRESRGSDSSASVMPRQPLDRALRETSSRRATPPQEQKNQGRRIVRRSLLPSLVGLFFFAILSVSIVFLVLRSTGVINMGPNVNFDTLWAKVKQNLEEEVWTLDSSTGLNVSSVKEGGSAEVNKTESPPQVPKPGVQNRGAEIPKPQKPVEKKTLEGLLKNVPDELTPPPLTIDLEKGNARRSSEQLGTAADRAQKALEGFWVAADFSERELYMAPSSKDRRDLAEGIFTKPLSPIISAVLLPSMGFHTEGRYDHYFNVSMETRGMSKMNSQNQVVEVHKWDNSDMYLVNTDAFLDMYTDRIVEYFNGRPSRVQLTAKILGDFFHYNDNEQVPAFEKKSYLKIRRSINGEIIGRAYFAKSSSLHQEVSSRMRKERGSWGVSTPMTVLLAWNVTEDPAKPYVQLVKVLSLDWNSK